MLQRRIAVGIILICASLLHISSGVNAQPATSTVLDTVTSIEKPGCLLIKVEFTLPFQYEWHFPFSSGEELRIRIKPIAADPGAPSILTQREATVPRLKRGAALLGVDLMEVAYEGDIAGGPYLTLLFRNPVAFKVAQGKDFRSIIVASPGPEASESCKPDLPAD